MVFQKLDYSAYSSSLYGNDRVPLQYSGYYPMHGYHTTPASFNIGNLNFAGNVFIDFFSTSSALSGTSSSSKILITDAARILNVAVVLHENC